MLSAFGASRRTLFKCVIVLLGLIAVVTPAHADTAAAPAGQPPVDVYSYDQKKAADGSTLYYTDKAAADADKDNKAAKTLNNGDTAWMLTSAALVLMMTGPGLALFYSGLVRRKNVLATMMQSFILMAVVSIVWAVIGYSLAVGDGSRFVVGRQFMFLYGVGADPNP